MANNGAWGAGADLPGDAHEHFDKENEVTIAHVQIHSKASSLGATSPSARVVRTALDREGTVTCAIIPDQLAMSVTRDFAGKLSKNIE